MSPRDNSQNTEQLLKSASLASLESIDKAETTTTTATPETFDNKLVLRSSKVQFGSIEIREYNRIVGDHPDVRVGPPVSIGWEYATRAPVSIDEYETTRPPYKLFLRMNSITRKNMLNNVFGYSEEEIRSAEKEVQKIRKQREVTNKQGKTGAKVESAVSSFRRTLRRSFSSENFLKAFSVAGSPIMVAGI
jgi:hypothetical protein